MPVNRRLIPIFIVVFVDILGFSIILPLLPYYAGQFGASPQTIGLLIATYSLCQFIAAPILGSWSDRRGRRPVLIYSQIGSCLGFILLGVALHLPNPVFWLFVARAIDGFSGGNLTVAQAYISDITRPEERAKTFGMIIGVSFSLGFMLGTTLNAFLSEFGYDIPAYAAAIFSFSSIMATTFLLPETEHHTDEVRPRGLALYTRVFDYLALPELRRLLMVFFLMVAPFALYVTMFALFAEQQLNFTAKQTSLFLAFVGFLGIIWQGAVIGPFVKRFGDYKALVVGLISSAIGLSYVSLVDVWWKLTFVALFFSFGHGIARPALTSILTQAAPQRRRGGVIGATTSLESFSRIIAPAAGGWIMAQHPTWLGWIGGALFALSAMIATTINAATNTSAEPQGSRGD